MLKHQIILYPDIADQFTGDKPITPYELRVGLSWYLCPVTISGNSEWVLINVEVGYCQLVTADGPDWWLIGSDLRNFLNLRLYFRIAGSISCLQRQ